MRVKHTFTNSIPDRVGFPGVQPSHWNADHTIEGDYGTRAAAAAATISSTVDYLRTAGYSTAGDGGGALYKRVSSEPSHAGKFQSADGAWFEIAEVFVTPNMLGAAQDGSTDDKTAIENASAVAAALRIPLRLTGGKTTGYAIASGATLSNLHDTIFESEAYLSFSGTGIALTIGTTTSALFANRRIIGVDIRRATQSDWSDNDTEIGLRIIRAATNEISIRRISGFTVGLQLWGVGGGTVYNKVTLGSFLENKVGLDLVASSTGWVNENVFIGGRFANLTENDGEDRIGIRARKTGTSSNLVNGNKFIGPSFELDDDAADPGEAIGCLFEFAASNAILHPRDEGNTVLLRQTDESRDNIIDPLVSDSATVANNVMPVVQANGQYPTIYVSYSATHDRWRAASGWSSKSGNSAWQASATELAFPGCAISTGTDLLAMDDGMTWNADYLSIPATRGLVRRVDTRSCKAIVVRRDVDSSAPGRVAIRCRDSSGNVLDLPSTARANSTSYSLNAKVTSGLANLHLECTTAGTSGASAPTVLRNPGDTVSDGTVTWTVRANPVRFGGFLGLTGVSAVWTNAAVHSSDRASDVVAYFRSDVAFADVIITGGTSACKLQGGFSIEAVAGYGPLISFHPLKLADDTRYASSKPDGSLGGNYTAGEFIRNTAPASGDPIGWFVTTTGSGASAAFADGPDLPTP